MIRFFLFFRFIILAVLTGLGLFYRIATLFPNFRQRLLETKAQLAEEKDVESVVANCDIGDWFILYQLGNWAAVAASDLLVWLVYMPVLLVKCIFYF